MWKKEGKYTCGTPYKTPPPAAKILDSCTKLAISPEVSFFVKFLRWVLHHHPIWTLHSLVRIHRVTSRHCLQILIVSNRHQAAQTELTVTSQDL
jgi:hypothetical protein